MDRRSWLWRRKSLEKSPGETESSGSLSSFSERYSDDQEVLRSSPNQTQSPEVSSTIASCDDQQTIKELTAKLSAALANVRAKEDLVNQHVKVAEEAVSGWEKAETELASVKKQLENTAQKNTSLEDRIGQLDGALKECIRQLRQAREEQEKKVHDVLAKNIAEWAEEKSMLESKLVELQSQLEATNREAESMNYDLQLKLEVVEKENSDLKLKLHYQSEQLRVQRLDLELSNIAAEAASKQHLESIKKMSKVESECRRLQAMSRRARLCNDYMHPTSSAYVESVTDSRSDTGERMVSSDNESSCPDLWASALVSKLNNIKSKDRNSGGITDSFLNIGIMDDFLEMERLAALHEDSHSPVKGNSDRSIAEDGQLKSESELVLQREDELEEKIARLESEKAELECILAETQNRLELKSESELVLQRTDELEEKVARLESEKTELECILAETQNRLEMSSKCLTEAEVELLELQSQLDSSHASNQVSERAAEAAEAKRNALEFKLEAANSEAQQLREKVVVLEGKAEKERMLVEELAIKCQKLEDELQRKREVVVQQATDSIEKLKVEQEKELAAAAGKYAECQQTIALLGLQLRSLASLEYFDHEDGKLETEGSALGQEREMFYGSISRSFDDLTQLPSAFFPSTGFRNLPVKVGPLI